MRPEAFAIRVVQNNRPDDETDGIMVVSIDAIEYHGDDIIVQYTDAALDPGILRVPFGRMLQVYH